MICNLFFIYINQIWEYFGSFVMFNVFFCIILLPIVVSYMFEGYLETREGSQGKAFPTCREILFSMILPLLKYKGKSANLSLQFIASVYLTANAKCSLQYAPRCQEQECQVWTMREFIKSFGNESFRLNCDVYLYLTNKLYSSLVFIRKLCLQMIKIFFQQHIMEFPTLIRPTQFRFGVQKTLEHFILLELRRKHLE